MQKVKIFILFACVSFCLASCREEKNNSEKTGNSTEKQRNHSKIDQLGYCDGPFAAFRYYRYPVMEFQNRYE